MTVGELVSANVVDKRVWDVEGDRATLELETADGATDSRAYPDCLGRLFALLPGASVVDVGANLGQTLLKVKRLDRRARYVGFEPNPWCVVYMEELVRVNRLEHCSIVPRARCRPWSVSVYTKSLSCALAQLINNCR